MSLKERKRSLRLTQMFLSLDKMIATKESKIAISMLVLLKSFSQTSLRADSPQKNQNSTG
jgi:hypothetical protein